MADVLPVLILGAGGHARVVIDILQRHNAKILGLLDPNTKLHGTVMFGVPVLGGDNVVQQYQPTSVRLVNAVGNKPRRNDTGLAIRRRLFENLRAKGYIFASVVSPDATVSAHAKLAQGCHVLTRAVIHPGTTVAENAIINTGAQIDHDCRIGAHTHVAPGAILCGGVTVGDTCHVGAGAVVIEGIQIADGALIGAGAVLTRDVTTGTTVFAAR